MKIIQIMDNFIMSGGVNSFVYDLCFELKDLGHDVTLIGILKEGYENNSVLYQLREKGIQVECLGASSKKEAILAHIYRLRMLIKKISNEEPTICNLHLKLGVLMGVAATIGVKHIKCVETYHNTYHNYHVQCWTLYPFIKKYICVSQTAQMEMKKRFGIPYRKSVTIPNGVSRDRIRERAHINEVCKQDHSVHIVSVGRLSYEKNFIVPIKAFVEMCNENVTYTLIGGGPQENELKKLAEKNDYVNVVGEKTRDYVLEELAKADIVVMPSLWEGRSILQLEAMALDKIMMISDAEGLREPFKEAALKGDECFRTCKFGYLVKTEDPKSYQEALVHFIANKSKFSSEYIKDISKENDMKSVAERYIKQFRNVSYGK